MNFYLQLKTQINPFFIVIARHDEFKNPHQFLLKLDYDVDDLIEEIKSLTYKDYLKCQIDSKNKFLFMYSFIKKIKNYIVYIKLSIKEVGKVIVYVISFHEATSNDLNERPYKEE